MAIGEVGLGGEIRRVSQVEKRIAEAQKLGFRRIVLPARTLSTHRQGSGIQVVEVESLVDAIEAMVGKGKG